MNIFQVLSQGKARLHEPSMSAMLGYLLDSNKDHGLGDAFVRAFLKLLDNDYFNQILTLDFIDSQTSLEEPYQLDGNRKDIDIQLSILDENKNEIHRLIIENKIKAGAANPKQLKEYYLAVLSDESDIDNLSIIFITPNINNKQLDAEYNNLIINKKSHKKFWIHWSASQKCISDLLKSLLSQEMTGEINPINEYMRHTIKAFVRHSILTTEPNTRKTMRTLEDLGEVVDETIIQTITGKYRVVRRDSSQIQVFNEDSGDKEVARRILGQYIDENNLPIDYPSLNTRMIGKKFFDFQRKC